MQELFPIMAGALIGVAVMAIRSQKLRAVALVIGCLVFGFLASAMSGELEESWSFLSVDTLLVFMGGFAVVILLTAVQRREAIGRFISGLRKS